MHFTAGYHILYFVRKVKNQKNYRNIFKLCNIIMIFFIDSLVSAFSYVDNASISVGDDFETWHLSIVK